jgi:hypothetical protein
LLESPTVGPGLANILADNADRYTWVAAVVGSNNAAGYQLAVGAPVMAVGGFNGTDPAPTLDQFQQMVADGKIHYSIRARMMFGAFGHGTGSREATDISQWVESHYAPIRVDGVVFYDLTRVPKNS